MSRYILTVEAQQDLREIRDYLAIESGPRVARYVVGAFIVAFRRLQELRAWDMGARIWRRARDYCSGPSSRTSSCTGVVAEPWRSLPSFTAGETFPRHCRRARFDALKRGGSAARLGARFHGMEEVKVRISPGPPKQSPTKHRVTKMLALFHVAEEVGRSPFGVQTRQDLDSSQRI